MIGYKILRQYRDGTWNSLTPINPVQYDIDKPTKQPSNGGPLCLFKSFFAANMFQKSSDDSEIFLCDYEPSKEQEAWTIIEPGLGRSNERITRTLTELPIGTVLASEVTIRQIA